MLTEQEKAREGIARAMAGVDEAWKEEAWECAIAACDQYLIFTTDEVWGMGLSKPSKGTANAMGGIMRGLVRNGKARMTPIQRPSTRNHSTSMPIYVSLTGPQCSDCDLKGFIWTVGEDGVKGRFCRCAVGTNQEFRTFYCELLEDIGKAE